MGNRAIIKGVGGQLGVYVHWNGGYDSVRAFTQYCKMKDFRSPEQDEAYGIARLAQVIGNFFGGGCSVGIVPVEKELTPKSVADYWLDNGIYELKDWEIVKHWNNDLIEPDAEWHEGYDLVETLLAIDESMPVTEQLGDEYILSPEVPVETLDIGDKVFIQKFDGKISKAEIVGFAPLDTIRHGRNVGTKPIINAYGDGDPANNPNNYIWQDTIKKAVK